MITTHKIPYREGELRIGWASWDDGSMKDRSIKYAYKDSSGKISRGSPELPFDILMDMMLHAADQKEITFELGSDAPIQKLETLSMGDLLEEKKKCVTTLMRLMQLKADFPWSDLEGVYNPIGSYYEEVKLEMERRKS